MTNVEWGRAVDWVNNELADDQNYGQTYGRINRERLVREMLQRSNEPGLEGIHEMPMGARRAQKAISIVNLVAREFEAEEGWDENPELVWDGTSWTWC